MNITTLLDPRGFLLFGLAGAAIGSALVLVDEGLAAFTLLVFGSWVLVVLPVNLLLLYPLLGLVYWIFPSPQPRIWASGFGSLMSFTAGLVSLTLIMSV
ncbi:hypothetical protein [Simiduia aestuariiviva]|uniref:Uncharacterized protein n=1 Tax=Simiduia aestuariiviva TaxID=1510459 RepID=A0A839UMC0_9GAMM|nr:hypothetical protein [Simiduia aestuariiviva]MBB3169334.1 hypothetical protein [Simiduia aestuariiviva]